MAVMAKFTAAQYADGLRNLLPRGRIWRAETGSVQTGFLDGLAQIYERTDSAAIQLIAESFPATAQAMLPEWDATLGIPDCCIGAPQNDNENRRQIIAKLIATGGQSVSFFINLAALLGFIITIDEFSTSHPGTGAPPGLIKSSDDWAHTWRVNIRKISESVKFFKVTSKVDEYLASLTLLDIECLFNRYKPAHTQIYYQYIEKK